MFGIFAFFPLLISNSVSAPVKDHSDLVAIIQEAFAVNDPTPIPASITTSISYALFPTMSMTDGTPNLIVSSTPLTISTQTPTPTASSMTLTRTNRPGQIAPDYTTVVPTPTPTASMTLTRTNRPAPALTLTTSSTSTATASTMPRRVLVPVQSPPPRQTARSQALGRRPKAGAGGTHGGGSGESPLVLDINHDGLVSAALNTGISMNSSDWTQRTGGAIHGDKMLAMCDLNKNGIIDGSEVFGDLTVFPLNPSKRTQEPNGFEALRAVAQALEKQYPDIQIIKSDRLHSETLVLLQPLQSALRRIGCDLGFISDDNRDPTKLEPLGDVLAIEISNYVEDPQAKLIKNGVAARQLGYYIDTQSRRWKINDVWFML